jgi:hypothetical protein
MQTCGFVDGEIHGKEARAAKVILHAVSKVGFCTLRDELRSTKTRCRIGLSCRFTAAGGRATKKFRKYWTCKIIAGQITRKGTIDHAERKSGTREN